MLSLQGYTTTNLGDLSNEVDGVAQFTDRFRRATRALVRVARHRLQLAEGLYQLLALRDQQWQPDEALQYLCRRATAIRSLLT
ncbi:hypothetical protein [Streptomyces sp. NPDC055036]